MKDTLVVMFPQAPDLSSSVFPLLVSALLTALVIYFLFIKKG